MSLAFFDRGPPAASKAFLNSALSLTCYPGAAALCVLLYFAAVTGSLAVGLEPIVLLWVPVCPCAALVLRVLARTALGDVTFLRAGIDGACLVCVLGLSLACLSYVCARLSLPLWDREIISADLYFGFSWLTAAEWFDHAPILLHVLNAAYATFTGQLIVTAVLLLAAGRLREIDRYFVTFICASLLAETASLLFPTLGPASSMASAVSFDHLSAIGRTTADIVLALRNGSLTIIDARALDGIISFPSLHAAVAILIPYHLRWSKPLLWLGAGLNVLMLVSAIPCGNHYLTDVLGGVLIAGLAIVTSGGVSVTGRRQARGRSAASRLPGMVRARLWNDILSRALHRKEGLAPHFAHHSINRDGGHFSRHRRRTQSDRSQAVAQGARHRAGAAGAIQGIGRCERRYGRARLHMAARARSAARRPRVRHSLQRRSARSPAAVPRQGSGSMVARARPFRPHRGP
jgi:membrane-associated phospholipid phosphatase